MNESPTGSAWPARPAIIAAVVFAALSTWAAIASQGFLEADACMHYMFARFALAEHHYLVSVWGRPLCTGVYAIPAAIGGLIAVRGMSLALAMACAAMTYRIAKNQGYRLPSIAVIALLAQPLFFLHSFSELTEMPFAATLIGAFWAYQRRQWLILAILVGILPLGRPEGFGFIILAAFALILHRRFYWLPLLVIPIILWSYSGWVIWGRPVEFPWWQWLGKNWPYSATSAYGTGSIFSFALRMPIVTSPIFFPFTLIGFWLSYRIVVQPLDHRKRCQVLIAVIPLLIFIGHSVLWKLGLMASNGELRYMLIVGPFWALLSGAGWEWAFERLRWTHPVRWAALGALVPIVANLAWPVVPLKLYADDLCAREIANWYRSDPKISREYPRIMTTLPALYYHMDLSKTDKKRAEDWSRPNVEKASPGTLLVYDDVYGMFNSDRTLQVPRDDVVAAGWIPLKSVTQDGKMCYLFLSPMNASGQPTHVNTPANE